jgi:predicted neuraminidase
MNRPGGAEEGAPVREVARRAATNPLPTAFCHGATLLPLADGDILGAWFGGTQEGLPDSGIYVARLRSGAPAWEAPKLVA